MDDYQTVNVRDQEMLETFSDRVVAPIGKKALELANKFTPVGYVENLKKKVVHAGNPPGFETDRFLILKVLGVVSCALWVILGVWLFSDNTLLLLLFIGFMCALAVMGPDLVLDRRIKERRNEIERRLPDTLDLLVISVEAGLGFEQALDRTAEAVPGPLSDELRRMLQETRMGASRADALRALDERTDVEDLRTFIVAMLQADTFGVSVARILHTQADEIRERRRQYAQEQSQKLPVKMLFPLVTCVFPATLVVVVLPGLLQVYDQLK
jgi:tight adherence protein C